MAQFLFLDSAKARPDMVPMTVPTTSQETPSLLSAFAPERDGLTTALGAALSPAQTVGEVRRALDRAGVAFARTTDDPDLQKAGLWLLEMVKSNLGLIDRATLAEVEYVETAAKRDWTMSLRPGLFYGAAGVLGVAGLVQGTMLAVIGAGALALIHAAGQFKGKLPFVKADPARLEDGRRMIAEARLRTDAHGFVAQITDSLKTADHILMRLAAPVDEAHWRDDGGLTGVLQNLLEAGAAEDTGFALDVVRKEVPNLLSRVGVEIVDDSPKTAHWFDELPALGVGPKRAQAAPALVADGRVLRRGTVWVRK